MDWLGDTIINLWDFTFSCWDWCMDTIQTVLTQSPVSIGGGTAWSAVSSIYSGILGTGYALLTLFFFVGIFKTVGSLTDLKRPEVSVRALVRLVLCKLLLDNGLNIVLYFIRIGQGLVSVVFGSISMESTLPTLPEAIETAIRGSTFLSKLVLLIFTIAAMCVIAVMALTIIMSVYGRFFKIYVTGALSPLALSTFAGEPTAHMGAHYLKAFAGACLEGVVIAIACCLYGAFVQVIPPIQVAEDMGVFVELSVYILTVVLHTVILSGLIKSADWLMQKYLGL